MERYIESQIERKNKSRCSYGEFGWRDNWDGAALFQFLRNLSIYYVFGRKNRTISFFVWLKSIIEQSRSIHYLLGESYDCAG
jgi:hypothetical protein